MSKWRTETALPDLLLLQVELAKLKKQQVEKTLTRLNKLLEQEARKHG